MKPSNRYQAEAGILVSYTYWDDSRALILKYIWLHNCLNILQYSA